MQQVGLEAVLPFENSGYAGTVLRIRSMTPSHLSVVSSDYQESHSSRAKRLLAEAKAAALEHTSALEHALEMVASLSSEISEGGDAYPVGVRELSRQLTDDTVSRLQTLNAILNRNTAAKA
jgi:hypothetical protein